MDKQYTYLLINFLTLFFPVVLSFDKRVQFYKKWKFIFPGLIITGCSFLLWDYLFTLFDVWTFNDKYVIGIYFLNLPLEEILFFITVPFACIFIYECLNYYVQKDILGGIGNIINVLMIALSVVMLVLFFNRVYTLITFGLLLLVALFLYIKKPPYIGRFYFAYFISLIPFYIVNGLLTSLPVVLYNDAQNSGMRVGTIPFEDHFYSLSMLLFNIIFFEYFRRRSAGANE